MIHDVKAYPNLQDSSQEPSTSFKYDLWDVLIMLESCHLENTSRIAYDDIHINNSYISAK